MNAELHSLPNLSDKSPPAGATGHHGDEGPSHFHKRGLSIYNHNHNPDPDQQYAHGANAVQAQRTPEAQEQSNAPVAHGMYEDRAMPLEGHLKKLKAAAESAPGRSRLANKLSELIDADHEGREES